MLKDLKHVFKQKFSKPIKSSIFFSSSGSNNYGALKIYSNQKGIYRFFCIEDEKEVTLYIGESHKTTHGLKKRVAQNFTAKDTGGTFRDNLALLKFNGDKKRAVSFIENQTFVQFIILGKGYSESQIKDLEQIAITLYKPLYNRNIWI